MKKEKIIEKIKIDKNFDFNKYNYSHSNIEDNFITEYTKKTETKTTIYLVCSIRGRKSGNCSGKARFNKLTNELEIYEKCVNINNNHKSIDFEQFKKLYINNNYDNIDMNIKLYQKFYVQCLLLDNKVYNYTDCIFIFNQKFHDKNFKITDDIFRKMKSNIIF